MAARKPNEAEASADRSSSPAPRGRLTKERVIAGAMALADRVGIEPLTIRRLADELGVKPMAIYHHVASKDEILDGMIDQVFADIELPPADLPWAEAMRVRSRSARDVLRQHPWAAPMMESRANPGPANLAHHDAVLGCFRQAGFSLEQTAHAYALIDAYIYGSALQAAAMPFTTPEEAAALADSIFDSFPAEHYPHLAEFTFGHVLKPGYDFAAEFDVGLDLILDGLAAAVGEG